MIDRRSWVTGLLMRLAAAPVVVKGSREPVAYLYNGVELPDINTVWTDKETYPYASILSFLGGYAVVLGQQVPSYSGSEYGPYVSGTVRNYLYKSNLYDEWTFNAEQNGQFLMDLHWTSHDILYEDSTEVYFAATDPIPVYE